MDSENVVYLNTINIKSDYQDTGDFIISQDVIPNQIFENIGDTVIAEFDINFSDLIEFEDTLKGINNTRVIKRFWRIAKKADVCKWSDWFEMDTDFKNMPQLPVTDQVMQVKWIRSGSNIDGNIQLLEWSLKGKWERDIKSDPITVLTSDNYREPVFIRPEDTYKVFRLDDFEVITRGETIEKMIDIEYRVSQDSWRTSTQWEKLTTENITTLMEKHDISPIRFFWIEYKVTRSGGDSTGTVNLYDINLIGDIQNVSVDYTKTNLLGIRECCSCLNTSYIGVGNLEGNGIPGFNCVADKPLDNMNTNGMACDDTELPSDIGKSHAGNLWNPYSIKKAVDLYERISEATVDMLGWDIVYFLTSPDKLGTDTIFHEHQLYNVVDENKIKVSVDRNQFPDNQITFNQFDLSLFDTFEIHVTKKEFKKYFGVDQRPSKEDFLWFCELNRMYQVEHAQPHKDFLNSAIYYKVILKKYNQKSSVKAADETIEARINELTKNTTLDELFGLDVEKNKEEVANKKETAPLTQDKIRYSFSAKIERELIRNGTLVINKYNYDLSNIAPDQKAITYLIEDNYVRKGDNRAYSCWFKVPEYVVNENFNFIDNYDGATQKGMRIDLCDNKFTIRLNDRKYEMEIDDLSDNTWYVYECNIDQRQRYIEQFLYKRNVDKEVEADRLKSSVLRKLSYSKQDHLPVEYELDDSDISIKGSSMNLTNIRLYNDVVSEKNHTKVLNQYIVRDTDYTIIVDNSNKHVSLPNFPYN